MTAFLNTVMGSLLRARQALVVPKKRTLEDLVNSKNVKSLVPPLPREVAVSFYLQSWKLIFAVYHMVTDKGVSRFDRYQAECVVPWVNDVLLLLTVALQVGWDICLGSMLQYFIGRLDSSWETSWTSSSSTSKRSSSPSSSTQNSSLLQVMWYDFKAIYLEWDFSKASL